MAPLKAKANAREIKPIDFRGPSKTAGPSKFKVYSENVKVNRQDRSSIGPKSTRTSLLTKKESSLANSTCLKDLANGIKESKASHVTHDKTKIGRKALADVSNIRGTSSRLEKLGVSRKSSNFGTLTTTAPRQPSTGVKGSSSQAFTVSRTAIKAGNTTLRKSSNFHGGQIQNTLENTARLIGRARNTVTRKSFPVLKKASESSRSGAQGDVGSTQKATRKIGFPLKSRVGGNLAQVSNLKSKAPKDRASDGFIQRAPKNQTTKEASQRSRKSVKPLVRNTIRNAAAHKNNPNCISTLDKSLGTASTRNAVATSSVNLTSESIRSQEEVLKGRISAENTKPVSEITVSKRSNRRKSYTSSLISRSKLVGDSKEVVEQEKLPNIDDQGNPLEVAEYVDDIYQYYWVMEMLPQAEGASAEDYMRTQTEVTPQMRGILVNWLIEVHFKFDLMPETLYLTVTLLDRYLSLVPIKKKDFQLAGLASLLLASKYEDFWHPRVTDLISISAESYNRKQVLEMEKHILKKLKFRLNLPTPYVFMLRFLKASQTDKQLEHLAFYLIELSLVECEALKFKPSLLCASAVYVARCTLNKLPPWTPLLGKHARYEESQIRDCAQMILKLHKAASKSLLKVTHEKYTSPEFSRVATIKPLNSL